MDSLTKFFLVLRFFFLLFNSEIFHPVVFLSDLGNETQIFLTKTFNERGELHITFWASGGKARGNLWLN